MWVLAEQGAMGWEGLKAGMAGDFTVGQAEKTD